MSKTKAEARVKELTDMHDWSGEYLRLQARVAELEGALGQCQRALEDAIEHRLDPFWAFAHQEAAVDRARKVLESKWVAEMDTR